MSQSRSYKLLFFALLCMLLPIVTVLTTQLIQKIEELNAMKDDYTVLLSKKIEMEKENDYLQEYLNRMKNDEDFRKRILRDRLGHAEQGDIIYRFENEK